MRCTGCARVRLVRGGTLQNPLCATCIESDPGVWRCCPRCGASGQLTPATCKRCALSDRLDQLLVDQHGAVTVPMQALRDFLLSGERPDSAATWLHRQDRARRLLSDLATGRLLLTHDTFDTLGPDKTARYLRELLVGAGVLPPRDELMARLERGLHSPIDAVPDPLQRHLLQQYALWHLLRRLRRRLAGAPASSNQCIKVRDHTRAVVGFLRLITTSDATL